MRILLPFLLILCVFTTSHAQTYTLEQLRTKLSRGNYSDQALGEFQKSIENLDGRPEVYEYIPGEVIAWSLMDGRFLLYEVFLIKDGVAAKVGVLPSGDAFLKKLNSYVPEKSRFIYRRELWTLPVVKQKLPDDSYLIKVDVTSYNPRPYEPSDDILRYNLEYATPDFANFRLLRLKNARSGEWIEAGDY